MFKSIAFIFAAFVIASVGLFSQTFNLETAKSKLEWEGKKVLGKHNGTVDIKSGSIVKSNDNFTGSFEIDMNSIKDLDLTDASYNAKLVGHLKSEDFFSVAKFPTAKLTITKAVPSKSDKGNYMITGSLTIKGISNEISFPANVTFSGKSFTATAEFILDRAKWDVRYGSGSFFDNLGDKAISNDMKFNVSLSAVIK